MQPLANIRDSHNVIDIEHMRALLRSVGAELKDTFETMRPIVSNDAMMATFRTIDGRAAEAIRSALAARYPGIAWHEGELAACDPALVHHDRSG
jgi:myo-inositol-1(or 4)-monophosphatase